jgi:4-aminobutyrate aminotransferase-like enzyme/Ser/Thr protein kinase RdoA (MazF antagonist)
LPEIKYTIPAFTTTDAIYLAKQWYGMEISAQPLPSERDKNFYLKNSAGQEFVLKIANLTESKEILEMQNSAMAHLATHAPELSIPKVCPSRSGELITTITNPQGEKHFLRLLTYLPGKVLAKANPHTDTLLHSLGELMGKADRALQTFHHPAAKRDLKWDINKIDWIQDYLKYITDPTQHKIVEDFLTQFQSSTLKTLPKLRHSIIHNDANDYNLLVNMTNNHNYQAVGVIDFGDMLYTATVCELAIATTYAMLNKPDPISVAAMVVAGYHKQFPLTPTEVELLYPLICLRLCLSVTNAAYQQTVAPENPYLTISTQPAWDLLAKLSKINSRLIHYTLRHACQLPACPQSITLVEWLKQNSDKMASVVAVDLKIARNVVFDLSFGSEDLGSREELSDTIAFSDKLFQQMKESGAMVGIGKYNEVRPIYTNEMFKVMGNTGTEWRTLHLGLDLFMAAGSPVFAPLAGRVHSFRNNAAALDYGPTIILQHQFQHGSGKLMEFFTLYGHLSIDSLPGLYVGKEIAAGEEIARIGNYDVNGGWPPHLHFQLIMDLLGQTAEFTGVARPREREIWLSICPDPNLILNIPLRDFPAEKKRSRAEIIKHRSAYIGHSLSLSYYNPLHIVQGSKQYLYDAEGRAYLDCVNNVAHVGHCHPQVVKAGQRQMVVLNTNTRYLHHKLVEYAEQLCATLPEPLSVCFFVCSGSEANELALRLARTHTHRQDIMVLDAAYHGNTSSLIEISPYKFKGRGGQGAPAYVHTITLPDLYRGVYKKDDLQAGAKYAKEVKTILSTLPTNRLAAFICESLPGCGGQIVLPDNYLKEVYQSVGAAGAVCIADEVQVGLGRVGTHFWGFETQGVVPDIVTMGKPLGNGHPLAAVVTTPAIAASFHNGMEYFNTFGGNPVSCAIGLAVLDVIAAEQLQLNALRVGNYLKEGLCQLMNHYPLIGDVRGIGLFIGVELVTNREDLTPAAAQADYIINRMRDYGILLSTDGQLHNVLKIKPPLVFNYADADLLLDTLDKVLAEDFLEVR